MKLVRIFAGIVLLLGISQPAQAQTARPEAARLFMLSVDRNALRLENGRTALVEAASAYCELVDQQFPRNSPAEEEWLSGEVQGGGDRPLRALNSPEFARRATAAFTSTCRSYVEEYRRGGRQAGLIGLAYAFVRYQGGAEAYASRNNIDAAELGVVALEDAGTALVFAALMETQAR